MKAIWNDQVLAEADEDKLIRIEGNWYFPPDSLKKDYFSSSDMKTTCFWKGEASYYDVKVGDETNEAAAWYYPQPKAGSVDRVGKDFTDFVAFWRGIEISS